MNASVNLAELIRHIQNLANKRDMSMEEAQEFQFFIELNSILNQVFVPGQIENLVPINLGICPFEKAQSIANSIGLDLVEGGSGTVYVGWTKHLDV